MQSHRTTAAPLVRQPPLIGAAARKRMNELRDQLVASMEAAPEDFDTRERLWMQRENLRAGL